MEPTRLGGGLGEPDSADPAAGPGAGAGGSQDALKKDFEMRLAKAVLEAREQAECEVRQEYEQKMIDLRDRVQQLQKELEASRAELRLSGELVDLNLNDPKLSMDPLENRASEEVNQQQQRMMQQMQQQLTQNQQMTSKLQVENDQLRKAGVMRQNMYKSMEQVGSKTN